MENFQRIKELTKERILARRRERRNKILWHVAICSSIVIIVLSFSVIFLTANAGEDSKYKVVIHSGCEEKSHYTINLNGEINENIPLEGNEIFIACSTDSKNGKFNEDVYMSLVKLTAQLIEEYELKIDDVVRHYDTSKESCPKYFVEYESAWEDFKIDVEEYKD